MPFKITIEINQKRIWEISARNCGSPTGDFETSSSRIYHFTAENIEREQKVEGELIFERERGVEALTAEIMDKLAGKRPTARPDKLDAFLAETTPVNRHCEQFGVEKTVRSMEEVSRGLSTPIDDLLEMIEGERPRRTPGRFKGKIHADSGPTQEDVIAGFEGKI